ncbi:tyrosine-type recombinase/integrase [bacterium]|nr:tyrosine-type recombinase/integrase [bacterium]
MLIEAVESYLAVRRAAGFALRSEDSLLRNFAEFSKSKGQQYVSSEIAIEWAAQAQSIKRRAARLADVIHFARHLRAEDRRHEVPPAVFGSEHRPRPVPYIFTKDSIQQIVKAASQLGRRDSFRGKTYSTFFALLACTGLRLSEAIRLRLDDITPDGLMIRCTKFRKSRLVPLHESAELGLDRYLQSRRSFAPFDDHVFVSLRRQALLGTDVQTAFGACIKKIGLTTGSRLPKPRIHSLRHTFAVRSLEACQVGRDRITKHMVALSTYLGHAKIADTYWYLEATPDLMNDIAETCEMFVSGGRP